MINETFAAYLEEIVARGVLRALREAGLSQQSTAPRRPASRPQVRFGFPATRPRCNDAIAAGDQFPNGSFLVGIETAVRVKRGHESGIRFPSEQFGNEVARSRPPPVHWCAFEEWPIDQEFTLEGVLK
jgi:hypothetical protein